MIDPGYFVLVGAVISPLVVTLGIAVLLHLVGPRTRLRVKPVVPLTLLIAQIALVPITWLMIRSAPDIVSSYSGAQCKDYTAIESIVWIFVFVAATLGGVAFGGATVENHTRIGRNLIFGLVVVAVPYVIAVSLILTAACSTWN